MTTIINSGVNGIIFALRHKNVHLRELSRITKLEGQSIMRYLNKLEGENIIKAEKQGNQKIYSLKHSKKTYAILTTQDIEKYEKLPNIRKNAIETFLSNLTEQPVFIILFGSTAKNNFTKNSDIDILIINNNLINTKSAEEEADAQTATKINTFQMIYEDFKKELKMKDDKVVQSAIETGYPLISHIKYYEELYNAK